MPLTPGCFHALRVVDEVVLIPATGVDVEPAKPDRGVIDDRLGRFQLGVEQVGDMHGGGRTGHGMTGQSPHSPMLSSQCFVTISVPCGSHSVLR
jgi:hypothetical protein